MQQPDQITIRPFTWDAWRALWLVRLAQLAEHGIILDPATIPAHPSPVSRAEPEWDLYHMATIYLPPPGNFWLASDAEQPIGMIGAQAIGTCIELRRMFVHPHYRRRGVGTRLVHALIGHCQQQGVPAIELWTADGGSGEALYTACGFRRAAAPGNEYANLQQLTSYTPGSDEIRMRFDGHARNTPNHASNPSMPS